MLWLWNAIQELLPVLTFFVVQYQFGFDAGLIAMSVLVIGLLALAFLTDRSVPRFAVASTAVLLLFSIPSIVTGNATYFQISDTIIDGVFAAILLGCWAVRFPLLKLLFDRVFAITDEAWLILALRWGVVLAVAAVLNELFRLGYSKDVWAWYKLISTIVIMLFGLYQFTLSARMRIPEESNRFGLRI